jgi:hypothetical protein
MASYFGYGRGDALPRGRSWLRVTVLEVDPALAGRAATSSCSRRWTC